MKWFFCWCQDTEFRADHNWKDLIRVAVASARAHTSLQPHFIYDGEPSAFTDELAARGVTVIFHRLSFTGAINAHHAANANWQAVARGAFLRFDIPLLADPADEFVLYTDADVLFQHDPALTHLRPALLAAAPESRRGDPGDMNSGVMLLNLGALREVRERLVSFTTSNLHLGLDQEILRAFLGRDYTLLPDGYNWKPYWGIDAAAPILHWHGPKPESVAAIIEGRIGRMYEPWQGLMKRDPAAYAHYTARQRAMLSAYHGASATPAAPTALPALRLGIAVTTLNRRDMVAALVRQIEALTDSPYDLVVCDDGSSDDTIETLRLMGVTVVAGPNQGIAWNKNRGLYHLLHVARSDIVILLDDDVRLGRKGWEAGLAEAAACYGHINTTFPANPIISGACTPADPGLGQILGGIAIGFSRQALAEIGYFDIRFGRYGHEHTDMTFRALRAGHGGIVVRNAGGTEMYFYLIDAPIEHVYVSSAGTQEDRDRNAELLMAVGADVIYRPAWRSDEQMKLFLAEIAGARCPPGQAAMHLNFYDTLADYPPMLSRAASPAGRPALVFAIGISATDDIARFLAAGSRVVGVEADIRRYYEVCDRFDADIEAGRLTLHHFGACATHGEIVGFAARGQHYHVLTINWPGLIARYGTPDYARIDIAGAETFLSSWPAGERLPARITATCHSFGTMQALYTCGYRAFQLVPDQWGEPPGAWVDLAGVARRFEEVAGERQDTRFVCHAAA